MARIEASKKIKNGKSIKIELEVQEGYIKDAVVSGDFFAFPNDEFEKLQNAFKNREASKKEVDKILDEYSGKVTFSGVTFSDLRELLRELGL
ncbi:MAG: lipoate protein ligase C-terminal domain-containing protein [Nitrososphaeria archaeon]